ncbi:hypothetical protein TGRUB_434600 [Toxoplasma gondii RUB]|uniref:Uncharacterized protein n=1 Tax=Toxoplasma gondii RUB TaxID=935652 RepID=A0A086LIS1_TOXGO|nr:hypothetical protein TGRUB_434600 [Toxoplasma gondii RUB]
MCFAHVKRWKENVFLKQSGVLAVLVICGYRTTVCFCRSEAPSKSAEEEPEKPSSGGVSRLASAPSLPSVSPSKSSQGAGSGPART